MQPARDLPHATWRLIKSPPGSGAWNMAVDEAILTFVNRGEAPPTFRLYAWDPPCLSLGYAQSIDDVDTARLAGLGWELVRRPTGGRAILHTDELTYAVIGPASEPRLAGSILQSYQRLSAALLLALQQLALPAESQVLAHPSDREIPEEPICFEVPSRYEITVGGKKLVGSAQARKNNGVLQHGTLPLTGDLTRITRVLHYPDSLARRQAADRLQRRATTVEAVIGREISWVTAGDAFRNAFEQALNLSLEAGELTAQEIDRAEQLKIEKYGNPAWNARR